jgi:sugar phosphate isomerase/epimerase
MADDVSRNRISRRSFGLGLAAAAVLAAAGSPAQAQSRISQRLGFQLHSSRNGGSLSKQLSNIAGVGYRMVEFDVTGLDDPGQMQELMQANGLSARSGHFSLNALRDNFSDCTQLARAFGIKIMVIPVLNRQERSGDAAGWKDVGRQVQSLCGKAANAGLKLAWHNHDFEVRGLDDGTVPLQHLFSAAPDLKWQPDIGWLQRAGADVTGWLGEYRRRIVSVHLKDVKRNRGGGEGGWADVGHGVVNWGAVLPLIGNAENYIVEHDEPSDYVRFARNSKATVDSWG